ncbi:prominin-like protein isoform X3 [Uranotaenia lowii]|uniref:prominin-like protein isoform X3 n=1 Tax=Uranotaenia lowii TaxID=190385 RepID=UPI00247A75E3|nr:prominin-like protein isoform X3 [Uranotaenia lowii]
MEGPRICSSCPQLLPKIQTTEQSRRCSKLTAAASSHSHYQNKRHSSTSSTSQSSKPQATMISSLVAAKAKSKAKASKSSRQSSSQRSWRFRRPWELMTAAAIFLLVAIFSSSSSSVQADSILKIRKTDFTRFRESPEFVSSTAYNARGMAPLYNLTNNVLKLFVDTNPVPEGYLIVREAQIGPGPNVSENNFGPLLKQYWAVLLVTVICVLLIVLMPIIGLCLCCCRCFGGCGGRTQPFDKKHDTCRRVILGLLLICAASSLVFGVVIAFATNSYMQHGVENITVSARHGVDDSRTFLQTTSRQISKVLVDNYQELSSTILGTLNDASEIIISRLEQQSKADNLNTLNEFLGQLPAIRENLDRMTLLTRELRVNASQLNDGLRGVKRELLASLTKCGTQECIDVMENYRIGRLDTNGIDYNSIQDRYFPRLPDLTEITRSVEDLVSGDIEKDVQRGVREMESLKLRLKETVRESIPKITSATDKTGQEIRAVANELTSRLNNVADFLGNNSYRSLETADEYIDRYSIYRYYVGLGISSVLLLILMCLFCGLLCGICGKRPDGYGDDCCNKGAGGRFLMFGVAIIFLTFSVILIVTLVSFLVGSVFRRSICDSLGNPRDSQMFEYIDVYFNINKQYEQIRTKGLGSRSKLLRQGPNRQVEAIQTAEIIESCKANNTIYEVLKLKNFYDINDIRQFPEEYGITQQLKDLKKQIRIDEVDILSEQAERDIEELRHSRLNDFHSERFVDNLTHNITENNLNDIAKKLREVANKVPSGKEMNDIKVNLKNQALHLSSYQANLVEPMLRYTNELVNLSTSLEKSIKFGKESFAVAIGDFLKDIKEAEEYINEKGQPFVEAVANELTEGILDQIHSYLSLVIEETTKQIGRCGPLANVYDSMSVATCNRIVDPFNGFWAGVGWCLAVFIPTIILCVKLSSLYSKSDPYPGPLVESGPKNKRRKKNDRRRDSRDRRDVYYEDGSPSGGHSREPRYNDMAPNSELQIPSILTNSDNEKKSTKLPDEISLPESPAKTESPPPSPNRLLSRLFQNSLFDDLHRSSSHQNTGSTHQVGLEVPWAAYRAVSRSNSSVGSVKSLGLLSNRAPSPLDYRTMSFRRPRSLADEHETTSKKDGRSSSRADSGYEKY